MKINEILTEHAIDVIDLQNEDMRQYLLTCPHLFETQSDYLELKEFLTQQNLVVGRIGETYFPVSILSIPLGKAMAISYSNVGGKLVDHKHGVYYFMVGEKTFRYPDGERESGDQLSNTLLFDSHDELHHFITLLTLKFSSWRTAKKVL